jgi:hypothetical protein
LVSAEFEVLTQRDPGETVDDDEKISERIGGILSEIRADTSSTQIHIKDPGKL